jgi:peptide/nickel transport system substrate-binding protein
LFIYHPDVLYGEDSAVAHTVLQAIYDGPIDLLDYNVEPVILSELPTLENGGVTLQSVTLGENEVFFNPVTLQPENLRIGDRFLPSGCNQPDCLETYSGGEVQMDEMVVEFTLREGVSWSDGQPVTASDSLYSFELDRSGELPTTKFMVDRTAEYRVMDERTVRWVGIPGYMDSDYRTNFWSPLPEHILGAYQLDELTDLDLANRLPIGWGPYAITGWGNRELTLVPNELYVSSGGVAPAFDQLIFRFIDEVSDAAIQQVLTDECDLVDETLLNPGDLDTAHDLQREGRLQVWSHPDAQLVRLDFNVAPELNSRPAFFQDVRTRKALAQCIDRAEIQSIMNGESGALPSTYINVEHPAALDDLEPLSYDPEAGKALLKQVGWVLDEDGPDSPRVAYGVPGIRTATPFSVALLAPDRAEFLEVAAVVEAGLEECGVDVQVQNIPPGLLSEPWPDGPVFGRQFDLVIWSWPEWISPLCEMFASWEIPSSGQPFGINATGYASEEYDAACQQLFVSISGMPGYREALEETQRLFAKDLPAVALYQPLRWTVSDSETCGIDIDGVATSILWNIEMLDSGDSCP